MVLLTTALPGVGVAVTHRVAAQLDDRAALRDGVPQLGCHQPRCRVVYGFGCDPGAEHFGGPGGWVTRKLAPRQQRRQLHLGVAAVFRAGTAGTTRWSPVGTNDAE